MGHAAASPNAAINPISSLILLVDVLDYTIGEIEERYSKRNILWISSLSYLPPRKENFLSYEALKSFVDLIECKTSFYK